MLKLLVQLPARSLGTQDHLPEISSVLRCVLMSYIRKAATKKIACFTLVLFHILFMIERPPKKKTLPVTTSFKDHYF